MMLREQSGVIPWRIQDGTIEILMVTSRQTGEWIVPKGSVEDHLGPLESAIEEAWEEAGARGTIDPDPVGAYRYEKYGWTLEVTLYPLRVTSLEDEWLEDAEREREWVSHEAAIARVRNPGLAAVLTEFDPSR